MENMGKLKLLKGKNSEELCKIVLPPLFTFVVNSLVYWGAPLIVGTGRSHGRKRIVPKKKNALESRLIRCVISSVSG